MSGEHRHEDIERRLADLEAVTLDHERRLQALEAGEPVPPPVEPPTDQPTPSARLSVIMEYDPDSVMRADPGWPDRANRAWDNGAFQQGYDSNKRLRIPGRQNDHIRFQNSWAPVVQANGDLKWDFVSSGNQTHSQWTLQRPGERDTGMASDSMFFAKDVHYAVSWTSRTDDLPGWLQMGQGYGCVHESLGQSDGKKNILSVFLHDGLCLRTIREGRTTISTPEDIRPQIPATVWFEYRLEWTMYGNADDWASLWYREPGDELWLFVDRHEGQIGTGEPSSSQGPNKGVIDNRWGAYVTRDNQRHSGLLRRYSIAMVP